ncbi:amino acid adenylation domain-containing protein [Azospirillum sp. 412522]|nr:non-ribosomal peptide synthetase [Azospirillum sp. 412522]MBY6263491.1 amino acid adenylation domain-containing protein [Azospirillum sp. 412522]
MSDKPALDAYPLSPMQQGMLFHSVSAPGSDVYVEQLTCALHGDLDGAAFRAAWEAVIARHGVLRTAFAWKGLPEPLQVVGPRVRLPLEEMDWRGLPLDAQARALAEFGETERRRGFDLARAPLMRLALIRLAGDECRLVWTWHHAILDAWSVPTLMRELLADYAARRSGGDVLPEPPRPYKDFIAWQRSQDRSAAEAFWRAELDGFDEPTPIDLGPTDLGPGEAGDAAYGLEFIEVPEAEVGALREAARAMGVTLNTMALGAWAILLGRYAGRREVLFGTAVAGRPPELPGIEGMVGLFINTLPVRARLVPGASLGGWLRALQQTQADARRHEHAPLADVQGWSAVPRGRSLFDSLLVVEDFPSHRQRLSGGGLRVGESDFVERADVPLTVTLAIREIGRLGVGFDRARFGTAAMRRLLGHMRTLLAGMAAADMAAESERSLGSLDPLPAAERAVLLGTWSRNQERTADGRRLPDRPVSRLFEDQVRRTPDATAALFAAPDGDRSLTYAGLNAAANRLARRLAALGIDPERRVAIGMAPSLDRLVAVLAVLKAGGAYVPLDPAFPRALLHDLVDDSGAAVVLADEALAPTLAGSSARHLLTLDDARAGPAAEIEADTNLPDAARPEHAAYLIHTSGSTGRRKGVLVTHRSLRLLVEAQVDAFRIGAGSRVLQFASFSFDASVSEIFTALLAGATLCMAAREDLLPSAGMLRLLERWRIGTATLPPSVLARLPAAALPDLATLVVAGEPCPADLAARWAPGRRFLNAYGPTETTVCASIAVVEPDGGKPSIGRPSGDTRIYLLDGDLNPVPAGVPGHLHVGGPGVSRGYAGRPDLTAAAFIPDPFGGEPGARLYRTGDLARFREDGSIEYLGRLDGQVKIRGIRIEPGEVEGVLRAEPDVREAAVLAVGEGEERRLVAFVVQGDAGAAARPLEWWPSIAEFFVYDELAYHAMTSDERRNDAYRAAIGAMVPGRVVLEVGTGPEALLSRFCVEAGASRVYAIEKLEDTFNRASARVRELGLEDRITVIHGDATEVTLPEPAEVCVSEIVGAIGGSEGAAAIMNGVRHLLAPGARMIPPRSTTLYAPVQLPEGLLHRPGFGPLAARYVHRIFGEVGYPFDIRLCVSGLDRSHLLAEPRPFEDFDYRGPVDPEYRSEAEFVLRRDGRFDGFLVWLTLDTGGGEPIDILDHEHCWLPVFFPAFHPGRGVLAGDRIASACGAVLCEDGLHTDYYVEGTLDRRGHGPEGFRHDSPHHARSFRANPFHRDFFRDGGIPSATPAQAAGPVESLRDRLRDRLPAALVPSTVLTLDRLPLTSSGKIDRRALLSLASGHAPREVGAPSEAPRTATEAAVVRIWQEVLKLPTVGLQTNFFDQGGHSLLLLEVQERLQRETGVAVPVTDLFKYPTVETLSDRLRQLAGQRDSGQRDSGHRDSGQADGGMDGGADSIRIRASARQDALERRRARHIVGSGAV